MDAFLIMLKNVAIFVLLTIPGYLLVKTKTMKAGDSGVLSTILTWLGMPFLILSGTLGINFSGDFIRSLLIVGVGGVLFNGIMIFLSAWLTKKDDSKKTGDHAVFHGVHQQWLFGNSLGLGCVWK